MNVCRLMPLLVMLLTLAVDGARAEQDVPFTEGERIFALRVKPLLSAKCLACHGDDPEQIEGGLDLTSQSATLQGGDSTRQVLVPGNAAESLLYLATTGADPDVVMPPKETDRLTQQQSRDIRNWINAGAPWPSSQKAAAIVASHTEQTSGDVPVKTSGGLSDEWTNRRYRPQNLWAYQPPRRPAVPRSSLDEEHNANPIDAFIMRKLRRGGITPAPRASRRLLIRRATFDLLGLPPAPEEVAAFLRDPSPEEEAFAQVVNRLLDSPHYGQQWGRHWLDVVRYADTAGFANDFERPHAWRYRDYVIRSLNEDKPYDQFIKEQIAGDEIDPHNPEMLIATGFLRMGPWEHTGMSVGRITRQQFLDDVTDSVGQVFLSHPLKCARCHDHKFDPIPTKDYYRIQAVFASTQFAEPDASFLSSENTSGFEDDRKYLQQRIARFEAILEDIQQKEERAARRWYAQRRLDYAPRSRLLKRGVPEENIAPRHVGLTTKDFGMQRIASKNLTRHRWELDRFKPIAFSVYSGTTRRFRAVTRRLNMPKDPVGEGTREMTAILPGGDLFSPSQEVTPGVLSALPGSHDALEPTEWNTIPDTIVGRRLAFAKWIASPRNTLTARSIVNRIWQYHFGQGIARNANNFGAMGGKPTHPELLDWLTARFIERGWSIKSLHRTIMNSATYCRSSRHPRMDEMVAKDPDRSTYFAFRPRRQSAEELRDSMLAISGELNLEMGGIPIRPNMNREAALQPRQIMGTYAPAYQPSPRPAQRNRRTIYALKMRGLRDPFLEVFNQPSSETSCEQRDTSTVTPQIFTLLNGQNTYDRSLALAAHLSKKTKSKPEVIRRLFVLMFARPSSAEELQECLAHWHTMSQRHRHLNLPRPEIRTEIVRHAIEEMNGEPFSFTEKLEVYEDYVPDLKPWDVSVDTRGLAEVCMVLFNSNEFFYIY